MDVHERITGSVLQSVKSIASASGAKSIFLYADALADGQSDFGDQFKVFFVTKTPREDQEQGELGRRVIRVPNVSLSRLGQVKIAVLFALSRQLISPDEVIVCLTGAAGTGALDTIAVMHVGSEFEMFLAPRSEEQISADVQPEVIEAVINIAAELGSEGREGKAIGALFVVGDSENVLPLSKQLILNPFRGYPENERNVLDDSLVETVKELASLDGAFVIRRDGVIESAGTYLKPSSQSEFELPKGLGARHQAAAAITNLTRAVAVSVSQSTGTVTVFRKGHIVAELEKPRSQLRLQPTGEL